MKANAPLVPAIVTAGDARAAKAIYGESKVFLEVAGQPMVARLVVTLQDVPEISEVWVVGNRARLEAVFANESVRASIHKPLFLVEQGRNLLENCWETYRRMLARDLETGRDPVGDEVDRFILYLSADLPFATPQEISTFIQRSSTEDCDYAVGLVPEDSIFDFRPKAPGEPGIDVAFFNLRDGRLRQSNLHYARPARLGNRNRIEDMYEHRHQKEFWNMATLAWKLFWSRGGGPAIVFLYCVMHLAGLADRWRWRWLADRLRGFVTLARNEQTISRVLGTRLRFVVTEAGGCAIDVDTEQEYDAVQANFEVWWSAQRARAEALYGPLPLPERAGGDRPADGSAQG
jgi:GTP:adenosylcobinamide-phosphate guanylyltransferase